MHGDHETYLGGRGVGSRCPCRLPEQIGAKKDAVYAKPLLDKYREVSINLPVAVLVAPESRNGDAKLPGDYLCRKLVLHPVTA